MAVFEPRQLNKNITHLLKVTATSLTELHRQTGIPLATIKRIQTDHNTNPTISSLVPIAQYFTLTIDQLIGIAPLPEQINITKQLTSSWKKIPIISWEAACHIHVKNHYPKHANFVDTDCEISNNAFALVISDKHMIGFLEHSILVIDPDLHPESGDYVIMHKQGQRNASLKQLILDDDDVYLKSPSVSSKIISANSDYKTIGVLVQVKNNLRNQF